MKMMYPSRPLHIAVYAVFQSSQNFEQDDLGCMITGICTSDESTAAAAPLASFLLVDFLLTGICGTSVLFFVTCVLSDACDEMKKAMFFDVSVASRTGT